MKVLHSGSLDVKSGGPALSTYLTLKGLGKEGIAAEMIMSPLNKKGKLIADDITIHYTEKLRDTRLGYMPQLRHTLDQLSLYDLYHVQGLWQYL